MATLQSFTASKDRFALDAGAFPASGTVAPSAARTATADFLISVKNATGLIVIVAATAKTSSPSVVFTVRGFDPTSGQVWTIATSAAVTDVATQIVRIHPSIVVADCKVNDIVPEYVLVHAEAANANALTYSVSAVATP